MPLTATRPGWVWPLRRAWFRRRRGRTFRDQRHDVRRPIDPPAGLVPILPQLLPWGWEVVRDECPARWRTGAVERARRGHGLAPDGPADTPRCLPVRHAHGRRL